MSVKNYEAATGFTNPLDKFREDFAKVRVFWGIVGTVVAMLGVSVPFVADNFFEVETFDTIIGIITAIVSQGLALYQLVRRTTPEGVVVSQSVVERRSVPFNPFTRYAIEG